MKDELLKPNFASTIFIKLHILFQDMFFDDNLWLKHNEATTIHHQPKYFWVLYTVSFLPFVVFLLSNDRHIIFFSLLPSLWVVIWIYSLFLLLLLLLFFHTWTTAITKKILKENRKLLILFYFSSSLVLISWSADFQTAKKQLSSRIDLVDSNVEECKEIAAATKFEVRLYISVIVFCYPLKCIDQTAWFCF